MMGTVWTFLRVLLLSPMGGEDPRVEAPDPRPPPTEWFCTCEDGHDMACQSPSPERPVRLAPGCALFAHAAPPTERALGLRVTTAGCDTDSIEAELTLYSEPLAAGVWESGLAIGGGASGHIVATPASLSTTGYEALALAVRNKGSRACALLGVDLPATTPAPDPVQGQLVAASHRVGLRISPSPEPIDYWMPLPSVNDWQTPIALDLRLTEGAVVRQKFSLDALGNLGVLLRFAEVAEPTSLELGWDAVVLLRRRAPGVNSSLREALPSPEQWLSSTATVQSGAPRIAGPAAEVCKSSNNPELVLTSLLQWRSELVSRRRGLWVRGPWFVDAESVVRRRRATCTGSANLMAALGRAAGIPSRLVAGIPVGAPVQMHFMVEAWFGSELGWRLYEPQRLQDWSPRDSFVTLRVASPQDEGEDALSRQRMIAPGTPLWAGDEVVSGWGDVWRDTSHPGIGDCRICERQATPLFEVHTTSEGLDALMRTAAEEWAWDLGLMQGGELDPARSELRQAAYTLASQGELEVTLAALQRQRGARSHIIGDESPP